MRILFVSPYIPSRVRVRPYSWIHSLVELGHEVHLVALRPPEDAWAPEDELRRRCASVEIFLLSRGRTLFNGVISLPGRIPLQVAYSHCPRAERHVAKLAEGGGHDIVHVEHLRGTSLASKVRDVPCVWDAVDSISELFAEAALLAPGRAQRWTARLDLGRTRRFEARAPLTFAKTLVTSPRDAEVFMQLAGKAARDRVVVLPNGVDTTYFAPLGGSGQRDAVIFTGKLSYHANAAAALRLVQRVMPVVWQRCPNTPVILAGKDPPEALVRLGADPRVHVTGYLDDLRPMFARAVVAVSPLVYGAGIQNKVLEAMACGVPVVTTPAAAQALTAKADHEIVVAESDAEFAQAVSTLLTDASRRRELGAAGRLYVERHHQWLRLAERLTAIYSTARGPLHSRTAS